MAVKYYSEFDQLDARDNSFHLIRIEVSNENYVDDPILLNMGGDALNIDFAHTEKMGPIRGSRAVMTYMVEEGGVFTGQDMYTDQEQYWIVNIYRDGGIIWSGFVIPDGCSEPFMDPPYEVTIQAVDGLALLKEYDFTGTAENTIIETISNCLEPISTNLNICVFNGLTFQTQPDDTDALALLNIQYENFSNPNGNGPVSKYEALESIMISWGMAIQQCEGEWFAVRLQDAEIGINMDMYRYDSNGVFIETFSHDGSLILGGPNSDVIHCNADQLRRTDFPYKEVNVRYRYGLFTNLLTSSQQKFLRGLTPGSFNGWTKGGAIDAFPKEDESDPYAGIYGQNNTGSNQLRLTDSISVGAGSVLRMNVKFNVGGGNAFSYVIQLVRGSEILYLGDDGFSDTYHILYFFNDRKYVSPVAAVQLSVGKYTDAEGEIDFGIPDDGGGELNIHILETHFLSNNTSGEGGLTKLYNISLVSLPGGSRILSDLATVVNASNYTTKPDVIDIYHGESDTDEYIGTLKKLDGTPTTGFKRPNEAGYYPFLQIIAEDIMYMHGKPMVIYSGSVYGYFNFMSIFSISGLSGIFIAVEANYNIKENTTQVVLQELGQEPVSLSSSTITHEYENPVNVNVSDA